LYTALYTPFEKESPETQLCIQCSTAVGSDFERIATQTSLGKDGSLKKNYGDFNVKKRRRRIEPLEQ